MSLGIWLDESPHKDAINWVDRTFMTNHGNCNETFKINNMTNNSKSTLASHARETLDHTSCVVAIVHHTKKMELNNVMLGELFVSCLVVTLTLQDIFSKTIRRIVKPLCNEI